MIKHQKPYDEKIKNITGAGDVSLNTEMGLFIEERTVQDRIKKEKTLYRADR